MTLYTREYIEQMKLKNRRLKKENILLKNKLKRMWDIIENKSGMLKAIRPVFEGTIYHKEIGKSQIKSKIGGKTR